MPTTFVELAAAEQDRLTAVARGLLDVAGARTGVDAAVDDLALLQRLFDAAVGRGELGAIGYLFGERLRRDLGLHWVVDAGAEDVEPALRYRATEVVFYPWRMLRRQLEAGGRVQLAPLVQATRDYLANLQRYALGERRPTARHD